MSFASRKKQDSANQLQHLLVLESKHNADRQPQIILRGAEESCAQVVAFTTQGDGTQKAKIKTAAHGVRERRVGRSRQGSAVMDMRRADHELSKGSEFAYRYGESRADEILLLMAGYVNVLRTVGREADMINASSPQVNEVAAVYTLHTSKFAFLFWKKVSPDALFAPLLTL